MESWQENGITLSLDQARRLTKMLYMPSCWAASERRELMKEIDGLVAAAEAADESRARIVDSYPTSKGSN